VAFLVSGLAVHDKNNALSLKLELHWTTFIIIVIIIIINIIIIIIIIIISLMQGIYTHIPEKTMSLGHIVLQLFCTVLYHNFTQCPVWLFSVLP
jgi:hypothetical protein